MEDVSTPYEVNGRSGQKARTRAALVDAARVLIGRGVTPTVAQAAEAAGLSRAAAYRYFPDRRSLLVAAHPETGATTMLGPDPSGDTSQRLDEVVQRFTRMIVDTEPQQRTMLRLSLEGDADARAALPLRQGRAIAWISEALEPLLEEGLTSVQVRRVALAVRSAIGIEALVWLIDIGGLTRDEVIESMRWSAQALLSAARSGRLPPS
jgi:AcrR family transcriptional regulator